MKHKWWSGWGGAARDTSLSLVMNAYIAKIFYMMYYHITIVLN